MRPLKNVLFCLIPAPAPFSKVSKFATRLRNSLVYYKVTSPVLCPGFFIMARVYRTFFAIAYTA
jgi:hypothetical protein